MLNRNQTSIDLLTSFIANPVAETYTPFVCYLQENYAATSMIVRQCLADNRSADLSPEVRGLLEAALVMLGNNENKTSVALVSNLVLQFPESSLLMSVLAECFRSGAKFADLPDTMDCKQLFPVEAKGWRPLQLGFYCHVKALMMTQGSYYWNSLGLFFLSGISAFELFSMADGKSLFPPEARDWNSVQLMAYCHAKALVLNPKNDNFWDNMGNAFSKGAMVADLPMDFVPMIFSCIRNDVPANYYCAVFCFEKALTFAHDSKKQNFHDHYKKAKNDLEQAIASSVMKKNEHQVQQISFLPAQQKTNTAMIQPSLAPSNQLTFRKPNDLITRNNHPNIKTIESLANAFLQDGRVNSYNEFLRGLMHISALSTYGVNYAHNRLVIEQLINKVPKSFSTIVAKAALILHAPETTEIQSEKLAVYLAQLVREYPGLPLLNYCIGASYYKGVPWKDTDYTHTYIGKDQFAIRSLLEEVKISPENDEAWKMLGSFIANRGPGRMSMCGEDLFKLMLPWDPKPKWKWKWNASEAYCLAKSIAIHPDVKEEVRLLSLLDKIQDQNVKQTIKNIAYPQQASNMLTTFFPHTVVDSVQWTNNFQHSVVQARPQQASNTLTKLSPLTVNQFPKSDNKRKFDEVPVSNKIAKININESPSLSQQSSRFFPLPNQAVTEGPVLHFDAKEIMKVIKILRGNNNCMINCVHLSKDLIEYFKTGKMPVSPSSVASSTPEEFSVLITTDWIERERGTPYLGVINSVVDETNFTDFPCDMEIPQTPGGTEGEPILNVDRFTQPSASYDEIDNKLKTLAKEHKQGVSFGLINVGRCGNYVENPGHTLFYFATSDCVWYADAQLFDGAKQLDYGCIFSDLSVYPFAGKDRLGPDTFGGIVFYIPCGPHIPELTLIQVKKEPVDECGQYFNI